MRPVGSTGVSLIGGIVETEQGKKRANFSARGFFARDVGLVCTRWKFVNCRDSVDFVGRGPDDKCHF